MKKVFALAFFHGNVSWKFVTTNYKINCINVFFYQCLTFKSNFKILNETQIEYWSDKGHNLTMMQVVTRFERRQNNAKNDNVVLCKDQMYNVY